MRNPTTAIFDEGEFIRRIPWKGSVRSGKTSPRNCGDTPDAGTATVAAATGAPANDVNSRFTARPVVPEFAIANPEEYEPTAPFDAPGVASTNIRKLVPEFAGTPACVSVIPLAA